jgi:hypothetical protein
VVHLAVADLAADLAAADFLVVEVVEVGSFCAKNLLLKVKTNILTQIV